MENNETKINEEIRELTEEELAQVTGGTTEQDLIHMVEEQMGNISKKDMQELIDEITKKQNIEL